MKKESIKALVESLGQKYSETLGINLSLADDREVFKWFLASLLFGAPITERSVIKTSECFEKHDALTPKKILGRGWDGLVRVLDEGGYTRYDFKTADKLLEVMRNLLGAYSGSLSLIHAQSSDARDLERRLRALGKGIGDVTVSIFLRELRGVWRKADPKPTRFVVEAGKRLGIVKKEAAAEEALRQLKVFWARNKLRRKSFVNFETALLRFEKDYFKKGRSPAFL